ncbi:LPD1 domain-containing protein [Bordetella flabilis]
MATVRWFDLSRFGAKLRVLPKSPLRGASLTCLDVFDQEAFTAHWKWDRTQAHRAALQEAWLNTCERLGFGDKSLVVYEPSPDGGAVRATRFMSARSQFTLRDIQALVPGVDAGDLKEMDVEDIALRTAPVPDMPQIWHAFVRDVLAIEAVGVWTPKINPFNRPWDEAQSIEEFWKAQRASERANPLITRRGLGNASQVRHALNAAGYRTNALVPFYVDESTALADGWRPGEIEKVDLPYALPLWVSDKGQIQALQDVRYVHELMDADPAHYLGVVKNGVIAGALREAHAIGQIVKRNMAQWRAWAANPASLELPDFLWGSITEVAGAHAELCEKYPTVVTSGLSDLSDGMEHERRGTFRAKPLIEMESGAMYWLSRLCARYASLRDDEVTALQADLNKALARGHELMGEHAQALAREELAAVSNVVRGAASGFTASSENSTSVSDGQVVNPSKEKKVRHEDAGEKIGGARKDFAKRAMVADDLEVMNEAERDLYVVKKNIWAPLDYAAMRADGVQAEAALGIKVVKDKLLPAPTRRGSTFYATPSDNSEADALYIKAISIVRDRMATVKTLDDFNAACKELFVIGNRDHEGNPTNTIFGRPIQVQWGSKACDVFYSGSNGRTPSQVYREIRRKIEIWNREPTEDEKWRSMIKPKAEKTQEKRDEEKAKAEVDRELHRPHLDRVERSGQDWRGGRDIQADDLLEHFGFRGVEFGNWLPQDERQQVLNMAFDALCDLAAALKVPPKGLSLGGNLGVAFGSRGSGGRNAALAHYEPARRVINLTRMNGAGFLAHEWMHALDHHLGGERGYLSEAVVGTGTVMANLSGRMHRRLAQAHEILERTEANAKKGLEYTRSWLYGQPQEVRDRLFDVLQAEYENAEAALYDEARRHIEAARSRPDFAQDGFRDDGAVNFSRQFDFADKVYQTLRAHCTSKSALTKVKGKIEGNLQFMMTNLAKVVSVKAAKDLGVELPAAFRGRSNCLPSEFVKEAEKLDKTRSSPYWATTRELFARAGAAYVIDKITEAGGRSDYLVFGSDEARYAEHPVGNPNPTGEDRRDLAAFFDALMAEYRLACLKEAEQEAVLEP